MPTKRRRVARGRATVPLTLAHMDLLLTGRTRGGLEVDALHADGIEYDQWIEFDDDLDLAALWRAHRPALMAEATRRGISEPLGVQFEQRDDS